VPGERRIPTWLPWALCWASVALLVSGTGLRIAFPEGADDAALYAVLGVLGYVLVPPVGGLIAARLPANPYGWVWCCLGLAYGVLTFSDGLRRTDAVPGLSMLALQVAALMCAFGLIVFVALLFPTGRLPGPAWRWPARAAIVVSGAGSLAVPFGAIAFDSSEVIRWAVSGRAGILLADPLDVALTLLFLLIVLAAVAPIVRFRRASPVERQQLKWFLFAAALATGNIILELAGVPFSPPVWAVFDAVTFALLPVAVGVAVLRYQLYEIDRIVSRTVSYGLLTATLIGLYLLVVALLRPLLEPLTGSSTMAVAASTLAVAAAFNPARRRLQDVVDRRFDRARYDAARAVDAFAARLRDQVDLDEVTAGLRDTVVATVAPTRVSVWLRVSSGTGGG
jgi:hypothetical protein